MKRRSLLHFGLVTLVAAALLAVAGPGFWRPRPTPASAPRLVRLEPETEEAVMVGDGAATRLRAIVVETPAVLHWTLDVPAAARFETFLSFERNHLDELGAITCRLRLDASKGGSGPPGPSTLLLERELALASAWLPVEADLSPLGGRRVELRLELACPEAVRVPKARFAVPVVSCPPAPLEWNVLLVSIDTLRADHLSAYGYARPTSPNIDALARRGLLFEQAETVQSATWPALTTLHTSLYPSAHGVKWNGHSMPEGLPTLADLLQGRGFSTSAFITNMTRGRHPGFSRLFLSRDGGQVEADRRALGQAVAQLGRERDRRFFMWVHFLSPHADYAPPAPFDRAFAQPGASRVRGEIEELSALRRSGAALSEADVAHVVGLYDGEIAFVDELVGRLLAALREHGLEKRTLVVLTADHGEDLYQHNRYFFHSPSIYGSSMRIPLVFALPGVLPEGRRSDHLASLVDVAPTILGLLGLPIPSTLQGENLLPGGGLPARPVRSLAFGETNGRIFTARSPDWRFVFNPEGHHPEAPGGPYRIAGAELFDLVVDAREERDLASARTEVVRAFTAQVQAFRARTARPGAAPAAPDPEALEELRALGYLSR